jgi:formiminoglutamate deiminase
VEIAAGHVLTSRGWTSPGIIDVRDGRIVEIRSGAAPSDRMAIPGMPNLHSHAFQRALAGRTERGSPAGHDSFWTWRTEMYELAGSIRPDDLEVIAAMLYVEMLEAGMTSVGEFHYVHHQPDGTPYADPAEMSRRLVAAAARTGIAITMLPVLYVHGGFGAPPSDLQRRFVMGVDRYLAIVEALRSANVATGVAPHSLRAVGEAELRDLLAGAGRCPIHIHAAEQAREVEESLAHLGARPVRWLLDRIGVDERWCLVHATHMDDGEVADLARSGAVAGLCPTTEANLGDGIFRGVEYATSGGRFGIGSDSHVVVDPAEELRALETSQRLIHRRRNLLQDDGSGRHVGRYVWSAAARGGGIALGRGGAIEAGLPADVVILDLAHPRLAGLSPNEALDAFILGSAHGAIAEVYVNGDRRVEGGRHRLHDEVVRAYRRRAE